MKPKKILVLGSGALKIGQAGEFDYSGSQAIKALKEEGIEVVLINPNIATIQTSEYMANRVYFLPIDHHFVSGVIERERPDGILLSFGGQTALNVGVELSDSGVLDKYGVRVLGTPVEAIRNTEDRDLFVRRLSEIGLKAPRSSAVSSLEGALEAAERIGYPVMARVAYALGGKGSGICRNRKELGERMKKALTHAKQILVEEYLEGWKEIEYEVVRDCNDNCIAVCNMENLDPMGIHTGESIVIAPTQTLNNHEYQKLRSLSIRLIRHIGIVGECNIQFALDPESDDYRIIEVNARLSRSSALASKATGYPLAFIATKLALGHSLTELENTITKKTIACFEPALDYVVVKAPRWDLQKFRRVSKRIGSEMKSVGEVMSIGRSFEEAFQKAIRMLDIGMEGLVCNPHIALGELEGELRNPTDKRVFAIAEALRRDLPVDRIRRLSGIDRWFIHRMTNIVGIESALREAGTGDISRGLLLRAKQAGFSDRQIGTALGIDELGARELRQGMGVTPVVKQIDTLAAEYPAATNYLYLTYHGSEDDLDFKEKGQVIVLGSGAYRIGSSVEFDWCCVNAVTTLRSLGYDTIMINNNPETVSTDYDICDKLYFDELSFEAVMDIYEKENPLGIMVSMGGQIPNNIALKCHKRGARILGTSPESIDRAEDRHKFSSLLDSLGIDQPVWKELKSLTDARAFCRRVGYPVLVRPSYVLSGSSMTVIFDENSLERYLRKASDVSREHPVVISKYIQNAREVEIDAVASGGKVVAWAVSEHVENAGVHSGDATMVIPPQKTYVETVKRIERIARKVAESLEITGPFNMQFLAKDNRVAVIECNLRSSRSFPFVSKVLKSNFIEIATKVMMGRKARSARSIWDIDYIGVKAPQFSFSRLRGADPTLSVEMSSTGEVACMGDDLEEAFLKAMLSTGYRIPDKGILVSLGGTENKVKSLESIRSLRTRGFDIYATDMTSRFLRQNGVENTMLHKVHEKRRPNISDRMTGKGLDLVINVPEEGKSKAMDDEYHIRRLAVDLSISLITNPQLAKLFITAINSKGPDDLRIKAWNDY
jgi:carbamoyl-phosphate synthase large subunit